MIASNLQLPRGGMLNCVLLSCLLFGLAGQARAQDDAATAPAAEPAAADAVAPDASAPAEAPAEPPLQTIPVAQPEPEPVAGPSRRPYTFAATRLRHTELDASAEDAFGIEVSYLLMPNIHAVAAVSAVESDDASGTESTQFELGGGWIAPLSAATDFNAVVRLVQRDINSEPQSQVKMGFEADAGIRTDLSARIEGSLAARYMESSRNTRVALAGAALFAMTPSISLGAEVTASTNSTAYGLVGRWAF